VGIYVWPWVLGFTLSQENIWNDFVDLSDQFEHIVVWEVFQSELSLASVSWIGFSENGVSVAWDDSSGFQGVPDEIVEFFVGDVFATEIFSELGQPDEDFLVGETVEWAGETVHGGGEGEVWIGEGGSDQVGGVGGNVATFVVGVDGEVESHELGELFVVVSDHVGEVFGPVSVLVNNAESGTVSVQVVVDLGGNGWQFSDQVHGIFEAVFPVFRFVGTLGVLSSKNGLTVEGIDGRSELSHWVQVGWEVVEHLNNVSWQVSGGGPLLRQLFDFSFGWDLSGNQQPEKTFWEWFAAFFGSWEEFLALWDGVSLEPDSFDWVENRGLPNHGFHASHTTVDHVDVDFTNFGFSMFGSEGFDFFLLLWDELDNLLSKGGH